MKQTIVFIILLQITPPYSVANMNINLFKVKTGLKIVETSNSTKTRSWISKSRIHCLSSCMKTTACQSLNYFPSTKLCNEFNGSIGSGQLINEVSTETIYKTIIDSPSCYPTCENNGLCIGNNLCKCVCGYIGNTCSIQNTNICSSNDTNLGQNIFLTTFDFGTNQISTGNAATFNFVSNYTQKTTSVFTIPGDYMIINSVTSESDRHAGAADHTPNDNGGYMLYINADDPFSTFYSRTIQNLNIGERYEFSAYVANTDRIHNGVLPKIRFQIRSVVIPNRVMAQWDCGPLIEFDTMTWQKCGVSFNATESVVTLQMISLASNVGNSEGNNFVVDDIRLNVCSSLDIQTY